MLEQIDKDLKSALLSGDKLKVETLKGLKNALQYEAVASGSKDRALSDEVIQRILAREAKKRQEAADLYKQGGNQARADSELSEKAIIEGYLPEQLSEEEIAQAVEEEFAKMESSSPAEMGKIIGALRAKLGPSADGATIARLVKERLG